MEGNKDLKFVQQDGENVNVNLVTGSIYLGKFNNVQYHERVSLSAHNILENISPQILLDMEMTLNTCYVQEMPSLYILEILK